MSATIKHCIKLISSLSTLSSENRTAAMAMLSPMLWVIPISDRKKTPNSKKVSKEKRCKYRRAKPSQILIHNPLF